MSRISIFLDMDDVPHLTKAEKDKILSGVPPWQLQARKSGIPGQGVGAIYPIPENAVICRPFEIPMHWPRSFAMDPGWNCTAVLWLAWDVDNGGAVAYDEYYRGQADPAVHVSAIHKRGKWIPGVIDPAAQKARGIDGELLLDVYRELGLNVHKADNTVVTGLIKCWDMLSTQNLRIFDTLNNWRKEFRLYRRDEKGNIIKKNDHLMDAMRYNVMSGKQYAVVPPEGEGGLPWFTWTPEMGNNGNGQWSG
jgi:hypothetical protein